MSHRVIYQQTWVFYIACGWGEEGGYALLILIPYCMIFTQNWCYEKNKFIVYIATLFGFIYFFADHNP